MAEGGNQNKDNSSSQFKKADFFLSAIAKRNKQGSVFLSPNKDEDSTFTDIVMKRQWRDKFDNNKYYSVKYIIKKKQSII